ncbi:MAG: hypothetical protein IJZ94_00885 [Clostridia bacterium]|nr:hypothetical protein [Clostridia bacterium]
MNNLIFLGTGAADWDINDKENFFRRNSAALLNGEIMLDCGPHVFDYLNDCEKPNLFDNVTDIVITHDHDDHLCAESVLRIAAKQKIRLCGAEIIREFVGEHKNIEYVILEPFKAYKIGNCEIIPLLANHDVVTDGNRQAFHYIITTPDGKKLFYGLDGAWFLRPSWQEMLKHKFHIMVLDCTVGDSHDWRIFEHNTIPMLRVMTKEIREQNMLSVGGKIIASHFARTLHASHGETEKILAKFGMDIAFDGMNIEF